MCDPSEAMGFFGRLLVALGLAKTVRPRIYPPPRPRLETRGAFSPIFSNHPR